MGRRTEPAVGQQYDLRYLSQLTPEEIRARLEEGTVPYHPRKARKSPLLLHPQENGDFYLISSGYHYYAQTYGIALLHPVPRPGSGDTVIYGTWEKRIKEKRKPENFLIILLLLGALVVLHQLFALDVRDTIREYLIGTAVAIAISLIVHFTAPKHQQEEQRNLRNFIETNLLE